MQSPERYCEIKLQVPRSHVDAVCNYITDNLTAGLVIGEEDGCESSDITFYVPDTLKVEQESALRTYLSEILELPSEEVIIDREFVKNVEWVERYRHSIKPVTIAGDLVVRPHWAEPLDHARYDIVIDPAMAFGTGTHETTRTCLSVMRRLFPNGATFLDLGCGSGILSILADKMGAKYIKAIDYDVMAIENCNENLKINNVKADFDVVFGSIEKCENDKPYDFICSNIIKTTILGMMPTLAKLIAKPGTLVLSGLLDDDEQEMSDALEQLGFGNYEIVPDNRWLTFVVKTS